jgi:acetyltransferase
MIDWANGRGVGFSHVVSIGDMSDADFGDLLDYLALDSATSAILIYAESITSPRKFMSAARIAARAKPVIAVKAGRSQAGARAAASHTGAMAGADAVFSAALRRAGILRVDGVRDLFDAAETLSSGLRLAGDRLAILTNGGGLGVLAADALEAAGGRLAQLSQETLARLEEKLPAAWSRSNPVDVLGEAHGDRYSAAIEALASDPGVDALLVMNCPTGVGDNREAADATAGARNRTNKPMIACWMGAATTSVPRAALAASEIPAHETPEEAVRAFLQLVEHGRNQRLLMEAPSPETPSRADREAARKIIELALADRRSLLTEPEAKAVLAAYAIPVVATVTATTPEDARRATEGMKGPYALKILSRDISHKSDVGGVRLDLEGPDAVLEAALDMLARVRRISPSARIDGFTVQPMVRRPHAVELILGAMVDPTFGPCILFGAGGVSAEVVADKSIGLPPLNAPLARDMIRQTRVSRLLAGYRDRKPADLNAITDVLVSVSNLMADLPEVQELDINPLLADAEGVIALDARIGVQPAQGAGHRRLAIRPYPKDLQGTLVAGGKHFDLRPIRPDDAERLAALAQACSPEDLRLRFHGGMRSLDARTAERLTQIDYDRELVLAALDPDHSFAGVVRMVFDPDFERAECALLVRTDRQDIGLGGALLEAALAYARTRGALSVWGHVLTENRRMLDLVRRHGGRVQYVPGEATISQVEFQLR